MIDRALRPNPRYPPLYDNYLDQYYAIGQYDRLISTFRRTVRDQLSWNYMLLAMSYAQLGRQADAASASADLQRRYADFSFERMLSDFGGIRDEATLAHYVDGIRKAGLRECATP